VYGGAEAFYRLIEDQIKPLIATRYRVDATRQVLYGQSYGGQFALRVLFRDPSAFSAYIISSPSIWWNEKEVLADERAFAERARAGEVRAKVLLTSAGDEQYRGTDPELLAAAQRNRLVDNAAELFDRLVRLHPQNLTVTRVVFDGETHGSVPPSSLTRGLRFALAPK
jgi:predicted alpha/beta superfamily hydrolase